MRTHNDLSPAGFKGGQGRSGQELEDQSAGVLILIAICLIMLFLTFFVGTCL